MKRTNTRSQRLMLIILFTGVMAVLVGVLGTAQQEGVLDSLKTELIPKYGQQTDYGIPLDLRNTAQFVEWFYTIELNESEQALKDSALSALVAPCCDDNSAATCCCECNLTRSVWGLSAYLIRDRAFDEEGVRQAAFDWLRFARPDYYIAAALEERGYEPSEFGLTTYGSCYRGICEFPLTEGGCAGMTELIEPDIATLPEVTPPEENECLDDEPVVVAPSFGLISVEDADLLIEANLGDAEFILLDVRTPSEFASAHIPGSANVNYRGETFSEDVLRFAVSSTLLVYCRSGARSAVAVRVLRDLGFCCLYDMSGGILAWTGAGYPTE